MQLINKNIRYAVILLCVWVINFSYASQPKQLFFATTDGLHGQVFVLDIASETLKKLPLTERSRQYTRWTAIHKVGAELVLIGAPKEMLTTLIQYNSTNSDLFELPPSVAERQHITYIDSVDKIPELTGKERSHMFVSFNKYDDFEAESIDYSELLKHNKACLYHIEKRMCEQWYLPPRLNELKIQLKKPGKVEIPWMYSSDQEQELNKDEYQQLLSSLVSKRKSGTKKGTVVNNKFTDKVVVKYLNREAGELMVSITKQYLISPELLYIQFQDDFTNLVITQALPEVFNQHLRMRELVSHSTFIVPL